MADVIGIGSTFVDYFFEADDAFLKKYKLNPEDDIYFHDRKNLSLKSLSKTTIYLSKSPGGMSVNTIKTLLSLGAEVGFHGIYGKDKEGAFFKKSLQGIETSHLQPTGKMSICACVLSNKRTKRLFISSMDKNDNDFFKHVDYDYLETAKILYVGPFFLHPKSAARKLSAVFNTIKDPHIAFAPSAVYCAYGLSFMKPLIKRTSILFLNAREMKLLTRKGPKEGSKMLIRLGPEIIVCTQGENGVLITTPTIQFFSKGKKITKIIDSTGAGDAFAGGFLYGVLLKKSLLWSAENGHKMARKTLSDFGMTALTTKTLPTQS